MTTISITTDAPADPAIVLEYGDALPELVRALNHVTRHHEAMEFPSDADRLIRNIAVAAGRLPQLLEQVAGWLAAEQAAGRVGIASGSRFITAARAVEVAGAYLERAQAQARILQRALDVVAEVTADMTGEGGGDG
jgi:hypothetical protein